MLRNSKKDLWHEILGNYLNHSGTSVPMEKVEKTHLDFERYKQNRSEEDKLRDRELFRPKLINKN